MDLGLLQDIKEGRQQFVKNIRASSANNKDKRGDRLVHAGNYLKDKNFIGSKLLGHVALKLGNKNSTPVD